MVLFQLFLELQKNRFTFDVLDSLKNDRLHKYNQQEEIEIQPIMTLRRSRSIWIC